MKILFPVSRDPLLEDSRRLACETAGTLDAEVEGLFVVDKEGIRRAEAGAPPGAIHIARQAEEEILERETTEGQSVLSDLCRRFREEGVHCRGEVRAGSPEVEIEKAAAGCDMVVAGLSSTFLFQERDEPGRLAFHLMDEKIIPLLLAASPFRPVRTAVVGCGGGPRTARAVGAMARIGLWKTGVRLVLLAVDDSPEEGRARIGEPARILRDNGYSPWEEKVLPGPKVETFSAFCEEFGADAVVLGGWGKRRWDEILGLSITGHFLQRKLHHMFLYM